MMAHQISQEHEFSWRDRLDSHLKQRFPSSQAQIKDSLHKHQFAANNFGDQFVSGTVPLWESLFTQLRTFDKSDKRVCRQTCLWPKLFLFARGLVSPGWVAFPWFQGRKYSTKNPRIFIQIFVEQFLGRKWTSAPNFMGAWTNKCVLSAGKTHVHGEKFLLLGGGGGVPDFIFMGARIFRGKYALRKVYALTWSTKLLRTLTSAWESKPCTRNLHPPQTK